MSFVVLSLPRSRTAWLAAFLNSANLNCEHELIARSDSFDHAIEKIRQGIGSVDTGQIFRINDITKDIPKVKVIVIDRDKEQVKKSLNKCGLNGLDSFIDKQSELLKEQRFPSFLYENIDDKIEEIWNIVSGGKNFPKEKYDAIKNYRVELVDIISYTRLLGIKKILNNYGISR